MKRLIFLVVVVLLAFYVGWPAWSGYQLSAALENKDVATVGRRIDFVSVRQSLEPVVTREVGSGMDRYLKDLGPFADMLSGVLKQQYGPKVVEATLNTLITPENVVRLYAEKDNVEAAAERIVVEELNKPGSPFAALFTGNKSTDGGASPTGGLQLPGGLGGFGGSLQKELDKAGGKQIDLKPILTKMIEQRRAERAAKAKTDTATAPPSSSGSSFGIGNVKRFGFNGPLAMEVGVAKNSAAAKPDVVAEMAFRGTGWMLTRLVPGE